MTQPPPPPPPNQPPQQGGFGPPPSVPPAAPPVQPGSPVPPGGQPPAGYGAPQQAPQGYGYPGQAPQGYGYPTPNPGYGYPQGTMPLQPQPGKPGKRGLNAQVLIIVAAVVAIALIVGGGVWYASSSKDDSGKKDETASSNGGTGDAKGSGGGGGGGGGAGTTSTEPVEKVPANTASKVLFQVPAPKVAKDSTIATTGSWLTDTVYAKSGIAEIVGYDPDKGTKLWTIKLPGPVCQGSNFTSGNKAAILYQAEMPTKAEPAHGCSQVAAIDLAAGKKLWTKTADSGDEPISFSNVTVSGNTVAVGSSSGGAAFDLASGKQLWAPKPTDTCYDAGYGGGPKLVAVRRCGAYDSPELHIQTIDPKSGKVISEYTMGGGIAYASVVSTDPLVVAADIGEAAKDGSGISDFFSIDNKTGKLRTRISAPSDQYAASCDGITKVEECHQIAVGNDRLYLSTEEHDGSGKFSETNEIVAIDLATGKQTGQRADAGDDYTIMPLRMDGTNIIAYKRPPYDKGGQIVSIDGGSFKETKLLENPATESVRDAETSMSPDYSEFLYSQGHLYMSAVFASDLTGSDDEEYLALGFGAS
ncbi:PQQ-binding-like beta-propeller repeat protein [Streptomyces sp. NPDC006332]|uniref:outer membrane protein assembly factor BamB family protein n=1 Tax=Streptomyces sp. NPDC006332 TaxID=3155456 RepID=UPI0033B89935